MPNVAGLLGLVLKLDKPKRTFFAIETEVYTSVGILGSITVLSSLAFGKLRNLLGC